MPESRNVDDEILDLSTAQEDLAEWMYTKENGRAPSKDDRSDPEYEQRRGWAGDILQHVYPTLADDFASFIQRGWAKANEFGREGTPAFRSGVSHATRILRGIAASNYAPRSFREPRTLSDLQWAMQRVSDEHRPIAVITDGDGNLAWDPMVGTHTALPTCSCGAGLYAACPTVRALDEIHQTWESRLITPGYSDDGHAVRYDHMGQLMDR